MREPYGDRDSPSGGNVERAMKGVTLTKKEETKQEGEGRRKT